MDCVEQAVRYFCHIWRIPLLAGPVRPSDRSLEPPAVLRAVLRAGDARLVQGAALWLSLLDVPLQLAGEWCGDDRRRVAYLCEVARCLGLLRGGPEPGHPPSWPQQVAGIEPADWKGRIALFPSPAPPMPPSRFGDRWGLVEVLAFSDYAAFQRKYLDRLRAPVAA